MKVKLNNRLQTVASFITTNRSIIDVGCDHALLSIYLVQTKDTKKVIASDIKQGPLMRAKENLKKFQVEKQIQIKLGPGIETIDEDIDTIIISGMGGLNMIGILKYSPSKYQNVDTLILSPNSDTDKVRREISKLGFYIENEKLVKDKNIIYPVILFKRGRKKYRYYEYLYGPVLMKQKDSLFFEYMQNEKIKKQKLLEVLPKKYFQKRWQLKKELHEILKIV